MDLPAEKQRLNDAAADLCQGAPLSSVKRLGRLFPDKLEEENIQILVRASQHGAYRNIPQSSDRALNVPSGPGHIGAVAPPQLITINCWVLSDRPESVFPVKIAPEESVGTLKKAIREEKKNKLRGIDADALDLWKASERIVQRFRRLSSSQVSIPPEGRHAVLLGLEDPKQIDGARKLDPTDPLSRIFGNGRDAEHLHIVVQAPDKGEMNHCFVEPTVYI